MPNCHFVSTMQKGLLRRFLLKLGQAFIMPALILSSCCVQAETLYGMNEEDLPRGILEEKRLIPLNEIAESAASRDDLVLTGIFNTIKVPFNLRADEIISDCKLTLIFTASPALLPKRSQLNVYLNRNLEASFPLETADLGHNITREVVLNPLLIEDRNEITLEFVGHYQEICEDLTNTSLWLSLDRQSSLELTSQKLNLANDLAIFPLPFRDEKVSRFETLPLVFPEKIELPMLKAAAIFASYMGTKASWRGMGFETYKNELPKEEHFIVFAVNEHLPDFLANEPKLKLPFTAPTVQILDAPYSNFAKMLIIGGRNADDLIKAATALATGSLILTGQRVTYEGDVTLTQRKPYDAPRFVDVTRPTPLGELADYPGQLSSSGYLPRPIELFMRLPPDLFMLRNSLIELNLKYRYTKPDPEALSQLRFLVNGVLVNSYNLDPEKMQNEIITRLPIIGNLFDLNGTETLIPAIILQRNNTLSFDFRYGISVHGGSPEQCLTHLIIPQQVEIDPTSTIDFSDLYHFARMPNLNLFAEAMYPFSRMADLEDTVILISPKSKSGTLTTLFNLMGRIGAVTGVPAYKLTLSESLGEDFADSDLIFIGSVTENFRTAASEEHLAAVTRAQQEDLMALFASSAAKESEADADQLTRFGPLAENSDLAVIMGFVSPLSRRHSAIALLDDGVRGASLLNRRLADPFALSGIAGSLAIVRESNVSSFDLEEPYYVGHLPWYMRIWYALTENSLLMVGAAILCALLIGTALYYLLSLLQKKRLQRKGD